MKLSDEKRKELMAQKLTEEQQKQVLEMLKNGTEIWTIAEKMWNFEFEHKDRRTWVFYSRINGLRHKNQLPIAKLNIAPDTKIAINQFISQRNEAQLVKLLATQPKAAKPSK